MVDGQEKQLLVSKIKARNAVQAKVKAQEALIQAKLATLEPSDKVIAQASLDYLNDLKEGNPEMVPKYLEALEQREKIIE